MDAGLGGGRARILIVLFFNFLADAARRVKVEKEIPTNFKSARQSNPWKNRPRSI
jgi:hypothetical protein